MVSRFLTFSVILLADGEWVKMEDKTEARKTEKIMEVIQRRKVGRQDLISNITDGENEH
jgi:hypothetical protein